jgi:hypothetical protein
VGNLCPSEFHRTNGCADMADIGTCVLACTARVLAMLGSLPFAAFRSRFTCRGLPVPLVFLLLALLRPSTSCMCLRLPPAHGKGTHRRISARYVRCKRYLSLQMSPRSRQAVGSLEKSIPRHPQQVHRSTRLSRGDHYQVVQLFGGKSGRRRKTRRLHIVHQGWGMLESRHWFNHLWTRVTARCRVGPVTAGTGSSSKSI